MTSNPLNRNHDTEDIVHWHALGEEEERQFCKKIAPRVALNVAINPEKVAGNKKAIDLVLREKEKDFEADLKVRRTPFFSAGKYGKNPQFSVTFNVKDLEYYERRYPEAHIIFYVNWKAETKYGVSISDLEGVWRATVHDIRRLVDSGVAPKHRYQKRVGDKVNAQESYVISLDDLQLVCRLV